MNIKIGKITCKISVYTSNSRIAIFLSNEEGPLTKLSINLSNTQLQNNEFILNPLLLQNSFRELCCNLLESGYFIDTRKRIQENKYVVWQFKNQGKPI